MARVRLKDVAKRYGSTPVLHRIDLEIADGELVVIVGSSGCGKSTLLRLIAGLEDVTTGEIHIGDRDVTRQPPAARGVAMIFQSYALYPHMTAYDNISFALSLAGREKAAVDRRVREVAAMLRIDELLDRYPRQLSGGQRQRVAIARAIVRQPEVFLFDEPLSNLDASLRAHTRLEILRMHRTLGATMIHVTHDQLEAMTLGDRIVLLNSGRIEQVGTPADLYHRPATRYAAAFLGSPGMNLLPVSVAGGVARLPSGATLRLPGIPDAASATLGVRPEDLRPVDEAGPDVLDAEVAVVEDVGDSRIVHAALLDGTLLAVRLNRGSRFGQGSVLHLAFDMGDAHLFDAEGARLPWPRSI
ncbi:MAG: ABC transporter ATP-binding protein [Vicinamibacterales bacterium]